jgi:hypothetical protein
MATVVIIFHPYSRGLDSIQLVELPSCVQYSRRIIPLRTSYLLLHLKYEIAFEKRVMLNQKRTCKLGVDLIIILSFTKDPSSIVNSTIQSRLFCTIAGPAISCPLGSSGLESAMN